MSTRHPTAKADPPPRPSQADPRQPGIPPRLPRGHGAMRDVPLDLDPRIDLTEPIYEEVLALRKAEKSDAE